MKSPVASITDARKKLLEAAGYHLHVHNLLKTIWQPDELEAFFTGLPVREWFNPSAPAIKSGEIVPEQQDKDSALRLMLNEPLLIRRPLIEISGEKLVGFDLEAINRIAAIGPSNDAELQQLMTENLVDCPQKVKNTQCD